MKLPEGKTLIPECLSHATTIVENPERVAQRLVRLARLVGRENVMAGTDCGFAQSPFAKRVHESIMWAKLRSLAEGAAIASARLWGRRSATWIDLHCARMQTGAAACRPPGTARNETCRAEKLSDDSVRQSRRDSPSQMRARHEPNPAELVCPRGAFSMSGEFR